MQQPLPAESEWYICTYLTVRPLEHLRCVIYIRAERKFSLVDVRMMACTSYRQRNYLRNYLTYRSRKEKGPGNESSIDSTVGGARMTISALLNANTLKALKALKTWSW